MAFSYEGSLSFGLVYIPVRLHGAVKQHDIGFNMLDRKTHSRVKYKKTCVDCGDREVKQEDIVKGYEYEDGKYVLFEDKDFEKLKTPKDKNITVSRFVDLKAVDPVYFDKSYYVAPTGGEKAFALLMEAMEETGKAGIAKTVLGTKETLVLIRVKDKKMMLNTLYFQDEIQANPAKEVTETVNAAELKVAKSIIEAMGGKFDPSEFKDEYRERVRAAIEQKIQGQEISEPQSVKAEKVTNLMEALKITLKQTEEKPKAKRPAKKSANA